MDADRVFPDEYVPNVEGSSYHPKWRQQNPNESSKWVAFRDKAKTYEKGDTLVPPTMQTKYGKALVAAGKLHMSVVDLGAVWTPPPEPPPTGNPLLWRPPGYPNYAGYVTISIPETGAVASPYGSAGQPWVINLNANTDYILDFDLRRNPDMGGLSILGGRNIVVIGGEIEILDMHGKTSFGLSEDDSARRDALVFKFQTGTIHVEGLYIHGMPTRYFIVGSAGLTYQIQNMRGEGSYYWNHDFGGSGAHSDATLEFFGSAPSEGRYDRCTFQYDNTGLAFYEGAPRYYIKDVNFRNDPSFPSGHNYIYKHPNSRVDLLTPMWVETGFLVNGTVLTSTQWNMFPGQGWSGGSGAIQSNGDGKSPGSWFRFQNPSESRVYAADGVTGGRVDYGVPPGGDFVPAGVAGRNYVSPGYV